MGKCRNLNLLVGESKAGLFFFTLFTAGLLIACQQNISQSEPKEFDFRPRATVDLKDFFEASQIKSPVSEQQTEAGSGQDLNIFKRLTRERQLELILKSDAELPKNISRRALYTFAEQEYFSRNQDVQLASLYDDALKQKPNDFKTRARLAWVLRRLGNMSAACREIAQALRQESKWPNSVVLWALCSISEADTQNAPVVREALRSMGQVIEAHPDYESPDPGISAITIKQALTEFRSSLKRPQ
jgi:tetratricopeptide (TPR) repeat protein